MVFEAFRRSLRQNSVRTHADSDSDMESKLENVSSATQSAAAASPNLTKSVSGSEHKSLLTASFPTVAMLTLVLISVVLGRQYVIDMLIYIDSLNWWESMLLFAVMFSLVAFPVMSGYVLLNIACGYTYGFVYGAMMTSACVTWAVVCAHLVMRKFCKSYVERTYVMNAQARALMEVVSGRNGYKLVFLMRFTPIPFGIQNAIFAVSKIKTIPYIISTVMGLSFTQIAYSYMGSRFRSIAEIFTADNSLGTWILLSLQIVVTVILMIAILILAKRELERSVRSGGKAATPCLSVANTHSKAIQTVDSADDLITFTQSKAKSHSRNLSVNIPPIIVASGVHIV